MSSKRPLESRTPAPTKPKSAAAAAVAASSKPKGSSAAKPPPPPPPATKSTKKMAKTAADVDEPEHEPTDDEESETRAAKQKRQFDGHVRVLIVHQPCEPTVLAEHLDLWFKPTWEDRLLMELAKHGPSDAFCPIDDATVCILPCYLSLNTSYRVGAPWKRGNPLDTSRAVAEEDADVAAFLHRRVQRRAAKYDFIFYTQTRSDHFVRSTFEAFTDRAQRSLALILATPDEPENAALITHLKFIGMMRHARVFSIPRCVSIYRMEAVTKRLLEAEYRLCIDRPAAQPNGAELWIADTWGDDLADHMDEAAADALVEQTNTNRRANGLPVLASNQYCALGPNWDAWKLGEVDLAAFNLTIADWASRPLRPLISLSDSADEKKVPPPEPAQPSADDVLLIKYAGHRVNGACEDQYGFECEAWFTIRASQWQKISALIRTPGLDTTHGCECGHDCECWIDANMLRVLDACTIKGRNPDTATLELLDIPSTKEARKNRKSMPLVKRALIEFTAELEWAKKH